LLAVEGRSARAILGSPDDMKPRSRATLFSIAAEPSSRPVFDRVIAKYYQGTRDATTLRLLGLPDARPGADAGT
jgi:uncharacterized protein (DUF1810 family)